MKIQGRVAHRLNVVGTVLACMVMCCSSFDDCVGGGDGHHKITQEEEEEEKDSSYAVVPYVLKVTDDLLQFVTPEITYNDEAGSHTVRLTSGDFTRTDSADNDGYKCRYTFEVRYNSFPATTQVYVRYIAKDGSAPVRDRYVLRHFLGRETATFHNMNIYDIYAPSHIGGQWVVSKDDVRDYIDKLATTPDIKCWTIDETGVHETDVKTVAGRFTVVNLSTKQSVQSGTINAAFGDTLKITFVPGGKVTGNLALAVSDLSKVNDSIYVFTTISNVRKTDFSISVVSSVLSENTSQPTTVSVNIESCVNVPYHLRVSEDLLKFVTPEITYNDPQGNTRTRLLEYADLAHSDSVTYSYGYNGETRYATYLPNADYSFSLRYYSLPATTEVRVRYISKDNVAVTRSNYEFAHGIDRGSASGAIYGDGGLRVINEAYFSVNITIDLSGSKKPQTEQTIRQCIEKLASTPDVRKWSIDEAGKVTEIK